MRDRYSEDYLRDMQEAIRLAIEFTEGMDFDDFRKDTKTILIIYNNYLRKSWLF